jgi:predicted metalloenzyme YecM
MKINERSKEQFYRTAGQFLEDCISKLEHKADDLSGCSIDHLCYRVETLECYDRFKNFLNSFSDKLVESEVAGRPIVTYKLKEPIYIREHIIKAVELPAPAGSKKYSEGFEHIEFVCSDSLSSIAQRNQNIDFSKPKFHSLGMEMKTKIDQYQVKFHHHSLESITNFEKNSCADSALKSLRLGELFLENYPLVVGTLPLGISVAGSDIDVVMESSDFEHTHGELKKAYGKFDEFELFSSRNDQGGYLCCRFKVHNTQVEFFVQDKHPTLQRGYNHYNIEEQLLKVGSEEFRLKLVEQRKQGIKTEQSYCNVLGISGDPFINLLSWSNLSDLSAAKRLQTLGLSEVD